MVDDVATKLLIDVKNNIEREVISLENSLQEKKELLERLETYISCNCNHEWVNDFIDNSIFKDSQKIEYCNKCLMTKSS